MLTSAYLVFSHLRMASSTCLCGSCLFRAVWNRGCLLSVKGNLPSPFCSRCLCMSSRLTAPPAHDSIFVTGNNRGRLCLFSPDWSDFVGPCLTFMCVAFQKLGRNSTSASVRSVFGSYSLVVEVSSPIRNNPFQAAAITAATSKLLSFLAARINTVRSSRVTGSRRRSSVFLRGKNSRIDHTSVLV